MSNQREVASLLRRCLAVTSTIGGTDFLVSKQQQLQHTSSGHHLARQPVSNHPLTTTAPPDVIITAIELLPSYDVHAVAAAVTEVVENRIMRRLPGSTLQRRSQRRAAAEAAVQQQSGSLDARGSVGGLSRLGVSPSSIGALNSGGGLLSPNTAAGAILFGTTPHSDGNMTPFGRSVEDSSSYFSGGGASLADSTLLSSDDHDVLVYVMSRAFSGEPEVRSSILSALLMLVVDQHAPSTCARNNAANLFGKLFAEKFFAGTTAPFYTPLTAEDDIVRDATATAYPDIMRIDLHPGDEMDDDRRVASDDPFEVVYDAFGRSRWGIVTPDQCHAILAILNTMTTVRHHDHPVVVVPSASGNNNARPQLMTTTTTMSLLAAFTSSPYRTMLYDLLIRTEAYRTASSVGRWFPCDNDNNNDDLDDEIILEEHQNYNPASEPISTTTTTPQQQKREEAAKRELYSVVWTLFDTLAQATTTTTSLSVVSDGKSSSSSVAATGPTGGSYHGPPIAIGATPPSSRVDNASALQSLPPPYGTSPAGAGGVSPPPPSYHLHMSQQSHNGGSQQAGNSHNGGGIGGSGQATTNVQSQQPQQGHSGGGPLGASASTSSMGNSFAFRCTTTSNNVSTDHVLNPAGGSGNMNASFGLPTHQQRFSQPPTQPSTPMTGSSSSRLHSSSSTPSTIAAMTHQHPAAHSSGASPLMFGTSEGPLSGSALSNVSLEQHVALQRLSLNPAQREEAKIRTVYVNKLDPRLTEGALRDYLDKCGQVLKVRLCGDLVGRTKYGFVEYSSSEAAATLVAKDREILGQSAVRCSLAKQPIQDIDPQMDAVIDKRGLVRACLFGFFKKEHQQQQQNHHTHSNNSSTASPSPSPNPHHQTNGPPSKPLTNSSSFGSSSFGVSSRVNNNNSMNASIST